MNFFSLVPWVSFPNNRFIFWEFFFQRYFRDSIIFFLIFSIFTCESIRFWAQCNSSMLGDFGDAILNLPRTFSFVSSYNSGSFCKLIKSNRRYLNCNLSNSLTKSSVSILITKESVSIQWPSKLLSPKSYCNLQTVLYKKNFDNS